MSDATALGGTEAGQQSPLALHRFWRQMGGHLRLVEANSQGVVWGIGYDHTAWVYTGGYGGGCFQGRARASPRLTSTSQHKRCWAPQVV